MRLLGALKFSFCDLRELKQYIATWARVLIGCDSLITDGVRAGAAAGIPAPHGETFRGLRAGEDATKVQRLGTPEPVNNYETLTVGI